MSAPSTGTSKPADADSRKIWLHTAPKLLNYLVLILSLGLITFISWDTYKGRNYLENPVYMKYQFAVCMVFLAEYFYRFIISRYKVRFFIFTLPFLLIAFPYLNLIEYFSINVDPHVLRWLCFVPIVRGLVALVMVVNFLTKNLSTTVFVSYALVLLPVVYMSGLIFFVAEKDVNTAVKNFWYALWWAGMNVTTIGCYINPVTTTGMIIGFILSLLGIIMLPLFTVYFGNVIELYNKKIKSLPK